MRSGIGNSPRDPLYISQTTATTDANGQPIPRSTSYAQQGDQQITIATLAASTPLTVPAGASAAIIQNNTSQPIRWRPNGAPTSTLGMRIASGGELRLEPGNAGLASMRFIREADGTGTLDVAYYG